MKRINSKSHIFSNYEIDLIEQSFEEIEEVYSSPRKGIPQSQYVIKINEGEVFCHDKNEIISMPKYLVGMWIQAYPSDNEFIDCRERIGSHRDNYGFQQPWSKCERVEKISYEYRKL